jgi:hypothetical protein
MSDTIRAAPDIAAVTWIANSLDYPVMEVARDPVPVLGEQQDFLDAL